MLTEHLDAATAAFQVGYESPSQFSREYRRLFGAPPLHDIKSLHQSLPVKGSTSMLVALGDRQKAVDERSIQ
jgi:AraC-like DNA-binding protein